MTPSPQSSRPLGRLRWALNRVVAIVAEDGYATDHALAFEFGLSLTPAELSIVLSVLYRSRRIDRCDGYLVLPARQLALVKSSDPADPDEPSWPPWEVA